MNNAMHVAAAAAAAATADHVYHWNLQQHIFYHNDPHIFTGSRDLPSAIVRIQHTYLIQSKTSCRTARAHLTVR